MIRDPQLARKGPVRLSSAVETQSSAPPFSEVTVELPPAGTPELRGPEELRTLRGHRAIIIFKKHVHTTVFIASNGLCIRDTPW